MIYIQYKLLSSAIHGIGCFADQDIKQGSCIAESSPLLDINLTHEQFHNLSLAEQKEIRHHGHYDKYTHRWHVDFDMTRFANHSITPNLKQMYNEKGYYIIATQDIIKGEELTIDYSDFEDTIHTRGKDIFS